MTSSRCRRTRYRYGGRRGEYTVYSFAFLNRSSHNIQRVSAGKAELEAGVAEAEREFAWLSRAGRAAEGSRARRLRDKLRDEVDELHDAYTARRARYSFVALGPRNSTSSIITRYSIGTPDGIDR